MPHHMNHMIFYWNDTGQITNQLNITHKSCQKMVSEQPRLACLPGRLDDLDKYQVNVSVDPHVIELKPEPVINIPQYCREYRVPHLKACDWTQAADSPLSDSKKAEWQTYRQALRDLPSTNASVTNVADIIYPTKPS